MDDVDGGPSTPEVLPGSERPTFRIMTTSISKKLWVTVAGDFLLSGTERVQYARQTLFLGKFAACLGPRLRISLGNFAACYSPHTIAYYCSSMWVSKKLQHVVQGQSNETSGPWDGGQSNLGHSLITHGSMADVTVRIFGFLRGWSTPSDVVRDSSFSKGKRVFAHKLVGLFDRVLN